MLRLQGQQTYPCLHQPSPEDPRDAGHRLAHGVRIGFPRTEFVVFVWDALINDFFFFRFVICRHNMYQYSQFFTLVRESIQDGTLQEKSAAFRATFGNEPIRTMEKHPNQIIVEAALQKRNQRLDGAEEGVVGIIDMGSAVPIPSLGAAVGAEDVEMEDGNKSNKKRHESDEAGGDGGSKDEVVEKKVKKAAESTSPL